MSSPDVHALTGAYVLDAVPELERVAFERHLAECDACAQEVRELRETAARLGRAAAAEPPPWLKSRVLARITEVRQLAPDQALGARGRRDRSRLALRLTTAAAAVLLVVAVALGVIVVRQQSSLDDTRTYADSLSSILKSGDARMASGAVSGGSVTVVDSRSQGKALVLTKDMPAPPAGKVYQAWLLSGGPARSAGLMNGDRLNVTGLGDADHIGITVEPEGGSPQPTMDPIVSVSL